MKNFASFDSAHLWRGHDRFLLFTLITYLVRQEKIRTEYLLNNRIRGTFYPFLRIRRVIRYGSK